MSQPIRAVVLSAGAWSQSSHLPALKGDPDVEVLALSSPNAETARSLAATFAVPAALTDWREALALKPDIAVVSSPPIAHEEQVIAALDAGAHVLVEKPFALNGATAARMRDAATRNGRSLLVGFGWPAAPIFALSRALIEGGEIGYFPEAAHYGPQEGGEDRIVLLLQFGGASGQGFIGPERLKQARLELAEHGTFERGAYSTEADGQRNNRDAYEAVWEHVKGAPPAYVEPAYKAPIVMRPQALPWKSTGDKWVEHKEIGVFPHRGLIVSGTRMDAGASIEFERLPSLHFLFVLEGRGELEGEELRKWSAVRLLPGAGGKLSAIEQLEFLELAVAPVI